MRIRDWSSDVFSSDLVHRSAYVDPEIFAAEKERIFNSSWLYVGHLSEIDQPGDFVTRRVAGRDLVLSRDSTGVMRCFLNACPHRGAKIVREKTGNARSFTCIYHAWQFRSEEHTSELQSLMRSSYAV